MRASFLVYLAATLAACLPASAPAAIYKCVGESNQPVYQDSPCPAGKELRNFDTDPAEVSVIPFRAVPGTTTIRRLPLPAPNPLLHPHTWWSKRML